MIPWRWPSMTITRCDGIFMIVSLPFPGSLLINKMQHWITPDLPDSAGHRSQHFYHVERLAQEGLIAQIPFTSCQGCAVIISRVLSICASRLGLTRDP